MKIRTGFVSNSSSSSFLIDKGDYNDTLELALHVALIISEHETNANPDSQEMEERYQAVLNNLINVKEVDLDPNIPIHIPSFIYDTYIGKKKENYYVDSDRKYLLNELENWQKKETKRIRLYLKEHEKYFYLSQYDVFGTIPLGKIEICSNESHDEIEKIKLKNGDFVCPICESDKIQENSLTGATEQRKFKGLITELKEKFKSPK